MVKYVLSVAAKINLLSYIYNYMFILCTILYLYVYTSLFYFLPFYYIVYFILLLFYVILLSIGCYNKEISLFAGQ